MAQITITIKDPAGKDAGTVELDDSVFGIQPNVPVMHQVVTAQLARRRSGTQSTKTRSEVRGGGGKPYRQKGTGNARQGSTRAPHYSGGGIALGPKPRDYGQRTPKKMIRLALRSALSDRASEGRVLVVDRWVFDTPSTKSAKAALTALGVEGRVLVVVDRDDATSALSFRNLPEVQLIQPGELNAYDVLCNDWIVFTSANVGVVVNHEERAVAGTAPAYHADDPAEGLRDPAESATGDTEASATQDPAEGPRDDATDADAGTTATASAPDGGADEAATGASATEKAPGEAADEPQAVTASAPDRSADEAATGEGSASDHTPPAQESPERVSSEGDQPA